MDIKLHLGGRRTGRTTEMIRWLLDGEPNQKRVIVSHSRAEAERLYKLAKRHVDSVENWQFLSCSDRRDRLIGHEVTEVGIDNLEWILRELLGTTAPVTKITATLAQDHKMGHQPGFIVDLDTSSVFSHLYD